MKTERLTLRKWNEADLAPFAALNADPEVMRYLRKPMTREESDAMARRIVEKFERQGFGMWAVEIDATKSFIGFVGLNIPTFESSFTPCVEIGWRLSREHWGHGYAVEAATACLAFAFDRVKLTEILSWTYRGNERSRRVMERIGMRRNPADDFDHPDLPETSPLRPHVLYRIKQSVWLGSE